MGLWDDVGRGALGWSTGGLSELGRKDPFGLGHGGYNPAAYTPTAPLQASDVKLPNALVGTFGNVGSSARAGIGATYDRMKARTAKEGALRGQIPGTNSYAAERYPIQQSLDEGALESALGGKLGNTAYTDTKEQRGYNQNLSLTDQIAAANKPSLLDQVFNGIGVAGKAGGQYAALLRRMPKTANYPMTAYDPAYDPYMGMA